MATNESLKLVDEALQAGNCGWAIRYMENYLADGELLAAGW